MSKQKVKILGESNEVCRVMQNGAQGVGYIDRTGLGQPGEIIEVPEFWVEDSFGDAAQKYNAD